MDGVLDRITAVRIANATRPGTGFPGTVGKAKGGKPATYSFKDLIFYFHRCDTFEQMCANVQMRRLVNVSNNPIDFFCCEKIAKKNQAIFTHIFKDIDHSFLFPFLFSRHVSHQPNDPANGQTNRQRHLNNCAYAVYAIDPRAMRDGGLSDRLVVFLVQGSNRLTQCVEHENLKLPVDRWGTNQTG